MTLSRAIEIVSQSNKTNVGITYKEILDAEKLLVEAGKRCRKCRYPAYPDFMPLLPGETEE